MDKIKAIKKPKPKNTMKKIKCPKCDGYGYTVEHDPHSIDRETGWHDCSFCPIQVQCEECCATGEIEIPEEEPKTNND